MSARWIPSWEIDDLILRWLAAERDYGTLVHGTEPAILQTDYAKIRLPELRREMERRA